MTFKRVLRFVAPLLASAVLVAGGGQLHSWPTKEAERQIIRSTREVSARTLDASLPAVPLTRWLVDAVGVDPGTTWDLGDCDLKPDPPEPADGYPMCVTAYAARSGIGIRLHILVGTSKRGVFGVPKVHEQSFMGCGQWDQQFHFRKIRRLSDITVNMKALQAEGVCGK
jgi:hypothetical protein